MRWIDARTHTFTDCGYAITHNTHGTTCIVARNQMRYIDTWLNCWIRFLFVDQFMSRGCNIITRFFGLCLVLANFCSNVCAVAKHKQLKMSSN